MADDIHAEQAKAAGGADFALTAKKTKTYSVRLKVDYWPEEDQRCEAGELIRLALEPAKALIAGGKAERADTLGESE